MDYSLENEVLMAIIQHRQIKNHVETDFSPHIDISDVPEAQIENTTLSRGVCALGLSYLTDIDPATAALQIVDGFNDNGIDAIYFDAGEKILYFVQSKWNNAHGGGIENGDVLKFLQGAKDLMNSHYDRFNHKVRSRENEIERALGLASKVIISIIYSGSGSFGDHNKNSIDNFIEEVDDTKELVNSVVINQNQLHSFILQGAQGSPVSDEIKLFSWGTVEEPVRAYYGQISAIDLANLSKKYGHRLFSKNIRTFLGSDSSVNRGIIDTIKENPESFWYFNNGVTALAQGIGRRAIGGANRDSGQFQCDGLSIVNGAQTVGSIASIVDENPDELCNAKVSMRIISLDDAPDGFATFITRNNNTQNKIDTRNFVALDAQQERLKTEFLVDGIDYEYRQGEIEHSSATRLGLVEATVALACLNEDVDLSTQAKREIGRLWEDIDRPPYKKLFNQNTNSEAVWKLVKSFRRIDGAITVKATNSIGKDRSILIHGNRLIAHICYQHLANNGAQGDLANVTDAVLEATVNENFDLLAADIQENHPDSYIASLFKNQTKCREIKDRLS